MDWMVAVCSWIQLFVCLEGKTQRAPLTEVRLAGAWPRLGLWVDLHGWLYLQKGPSYLKQSKPDQGKRLTKRKRSSAPCRFQYVPIVIQMTFICFNRAVSEHP